MTQSITVACQLGPAYSASTISFKIFNVDGTQYADWTSSGFSQIGTTGTFLKANVSAPDAGGYIQFSADGGSTVLAAVADVSSINVAVASMATDSLTAAALSVGAVSEIQSGLSTLTAQQVWEYGTRTLTSFGTLVSDIVTGLTTGTYQGRAWRDIWLDVWKQVVGDFVADDTDDPTTVTYQSPDGSTELIHTITDTTRNWSE